MADTRPSWRSGDGDRELYCITANAMTSVDMLVLLPLSEADGIRLPGEEDLELRDEMDAALLTLAEDPDLVSDSVGVVEISGSVSQRLARLEEVV